MLALAQGLSSSEAVLTDPLTVLFRNGNFCGLEESAIW